MGRGMIHGRFQPFHNGHLAYLLGAATRCDELFVGITNPDARHLRPEPADPLRHLAESNPWSYVERLLMVEAAAAGAGVAVHVVPFPIDEPALWPAYVPAGAVQFVRLFSAWGEAKVERLAAPVRGRRPRRGSGEGRLRRAGARALARAAPGASSCRRPSPPSF